MKRLVSIVLLVFFVSQAFAQQKKILHDQSYDKKLFHLGFTLGTNQMNYRIFPDSTLLFTGLADSVYRVESHGMVGIDLGIISELRLGDYLSLRFLPGLLFGQRNLVYQLRKKGSPRFEPTFKEYEMKVSSIYIDAPLLLKFKAQRINNYRPYLIGGAAIRYDLDTKRIGKNNDDYTINQNPLDYFYEFGFGVDFFLVYFKFAAEFKYSFGMRNILRQEPTEYCSVMNGLKSRMFILSFHFE
ncbi:MAG: PorT family protein [Bacteroidales bacterium]|nr:PorT family protein [Bacteroidales bacterium]